MKLRRAVAAMLAGVLLIAGLGMGYGVLLRFRENIHACQQSLNQEEQEGCAEGGDVLCVPGAFHAHLADLKKDSIRLLFSCGLILAGLALTICYVNSLLLENRKTTRELEQLKQRQAALETINEQTRQLAHHQRLETIGALTASIAHEFNNLLTPIMSYSLMTLEKLPPEEEELYDNVLEIYNASQKAKVIISRLSDLSRKNSPRSFRPVSLDELVKKTLDLALSARPEQVAVKLNLNCWDLRIPANEIQICQLLLNLILNAFQAMGKAGTLTIETTYDDDFVHLYCTDTGCGIPEEIRGRIFDPFFTTKEPGKGTGLGLAIAAQVAADHGGSISCADAEGGGTRFHVSLSRFMEAEVE